MSDSHWSSRQAAEVEAMVELMFFVARADGEFSVAERRAFLETVESLSEGHLDSSDLLELMDRAQAALEVQGMDSRLTDLAAHLPDELAKRLAFGLCTQLALSDGPYQDTERNMLDQIAVALQISPEDDEEIAQSVRLSQRE